MNNIRRESTVPTSARETQAELQKQFTDASFGGGFGMGSSSMGSYKRFQAAIDSFDEDAFLQECSEALSAK